MGLSFQGWDKALIKQDYCGEIRIKEDCCGWIVLNSGVTWIK